MEIVKLRWAGSDYFIYNFKFLGDGYWFSWCNVLPVDVESRLVDLRGRLVREYEERTRGSRSLYERARRVLPGGVTYQIRFLKPYPPYIERAEGTRVWDVDGNVYVDYWMGHGTHLLGHAPSFLLSRVFELASNGTHLGYENPLAVEYAEMLARVVPNVDLLRFANSGTEANMYAARLVRAYTGRNYIVKIEGGWHGGYDSLHVGVHPPFEEPESLGLPQDFTRYTITVPYNDVNALEDAFKRYNPAALFIEPVLGAGGCIGPEPGYLREVRRLTYEYDVLLVFDEVITGFRLALGGGQEYFNVDADLVVLGKAVAGGFPGAGAFGGRADVMEYLDHVKRPDPKRRSFHGGTFSGNTVSIAAGYTFISYLKENRWLYDKANNAWLKARRTLDKICEEHDGICWTTGEGTMTGIHFTRSRPRNVREAHELRWSRLMEEVANLYMRLNGILYISDHQVHLLPALTHSNEEIKKFTESFENLLNLVKS